MLDVPAVAIIVPVLARPHRVQPTLDSIEAATPEPHRVLFVADAGDEQELAALEAAGADYMVIARRVRTYAVKINLGYRATSEPMVFTAADDLHYHDGWYATALAAMNACRHGDETCPCQDGDSCHYAPPDPMPCPRTGVRGCTSCKRASVVGTNDLLNPRVIAGEHSTHSLVRRSYVEQRSAVVDKPNAIYCELYPHQYCDDEMVQTAMARGVYAHAHDSVVEHLHPWAGKAPSDSTYRLGQRRDLTRMARMTFTQRRRLWLSQ